jgi:hypothetical protein
MEEITTYIVVGVAVSVGSYIAYKLIDKVILPKSREFFFKRKTKKLLKSNKILTFYLDPMEISFLLAQKLEPNPSDEVIKIYRQVYQMPSIVDDDSTLKEALCVLTTGITMAEKTNRYSYHKAFLEFATNQLNAKAWKYYCTLITINMFLRKAKHLSQQALKIFIMEIMRGNAYIKEK